MDSGKEDDEDEAIEHGGSTSKSEIADSSKIGEIPNVIKSNYFNINVNKHMISFTPSLDTTV